MLLVILFDFETLTKKEGNSEIYEFGKNKKQKRLLLSTTTIPVSPWLQLSNLNQISHLENDFIKHQF